MPAAALTESLLTPREAAKYLRLSERSLYAISAPRGPIPVIRPTPHTVRYAMADLAAYVASVRDASTGEEVARG